MTRDDSLRDWTVVSAANAGFASSRSKAVADTDESERRILSIQFIDLESKRKSFYIFQKVYTSTILYIHTGLYCQSDMQLVGKT